MSSKLIRFLVDNYYLVQDQRKRLDLQISGIENPEPLQNIREVFFSAEKMMKRDIEKWCKGDFMATWAMSIVGIGPIIAGGLSAHIDIEKAPTAGAIWRFAGLCPDQKLVKGKTRSWNAQLKVLCYHAGESFIKNKGRPTCVYGQIFVEQKLRYQKKNDNGDYAERAAALLQEKKFGKTTEAYKWLSQGRLPPAQINAMARRWTVKLFLSHWHEVAYIHHFQKEPPNPYPLAHLGHVHKIEPPNTLQEKVA